MSFQSYAFLLLFLPLVTAGWWLLNRRVSGGAARGFLLAACLVFYGSVSRPCLLILLGSALVNFALGRLLLSGRGPRRLWLAVAVAANLGTLGYFKYVNFFLDNVNLLFSTGLSHRAVLLPLGISFFTFQQIAYLADLYRGEDRPVYSLPDYLLFVSFFPCVTAGPIAWHHEVIPQLRRPQGPIREGLAEGVVLLSTGLAKKVLLADVFGKAADWGFGGDGAMNSLTALAVALAYTFQLYFDFSGYTDMARGAARMLGVRLPENFTSPYKALSISGFWKSWHMTMTRFFTRYLYIPLGGSRGSTARTCRNIMIVFLLSGLWHGADWTFVVWGGLHGAAMVLDRLAGSRRDKLHPALGWGLTFAYVTFCWIFFRAESLSQGLSMCKAIARCDLGPLAGGFTQCFLTPELSWLTRLLSLSADRTALLACLGFFLLAFLLCLQGRTASERLKGRALGTGAGLWYGFLSFWALISMTGITQFLYANF